MLQRLSNVLAVAVLAVIGLGQTRPAADEYLQRGLNAIRRHDFAEAESLIKTGLNIEPSSAIGYDLLGIASDGLGKQSEAEKCFRQALHLNPKFVAAHNDLARCLYRRGMVEPAVQEFQQALRLDPRNFTANFNLGVISRDRKRYAEAVKYLEIAREMLPSDIATLLSLTDIYYRAGKAEKAALISRDLMQLRPDDPQVNFTLGTLLLEQQRYAEAAQCLEQARVAVPRNFELLHDLGQAYTHLGKYAEAEQAFLAALSLRDDAVETLYQLAVAYTKWEHSDQAIQVLVRARQLAPASPDILLLLGRVSIQEGFIDDAVEVLQRCVNINSEKIEPHLLLGEAFTRLKNYDKALAEYELMARLDPRNPQSYVSLGRTYQYLRRYPEAEGALRKALEIDPKSTQAAYYMGLIASDQNDYAGAKRWYTKVLAVDPKHLAALYDMGVTFMHEDNYALAQQYLDRAVGVAPTFSQLYYRLSVVYRHLKNPEKAAQAFALFKKYEQMDEQRRDYRPYGVLEFVKETQDLPERERLQRYRDALLKTAETRPDDLNVLFMQAQVYFRLGEDAQALERIARISSLQPDKTTARMRSASLLTKFNHYPEAVGELKAAVEKQPEADEPRLALAALYCRMQRAVDARRVLSEAPPRSAQSGAFHNLLGRILIHEGDIAGGMKELQQAVSSEPDREDYIVDLAIESAAAGQFSQIHLVLLKARAKSPASSHLLFAEGICNQLSGHYADADRAFQTAAELAFQWEAPYLAEANLLRHAGSPARAAEILDQAAALFPRSPWPHYFKALVLTKNAADSSQVSSEFQRSLDLAPLQPEVYPAILNESLRHHDCAQSQEIWKQMRQLGLAPQLDPSQWCMGDSWASGRNRTPGEELQGSPEWRWIVDLAHQ
jgi:tetratricopeptide (TPR) repeat protein